MENIKEYLAITAAGTDEFNKQVNLAIKNGWKPFGGISSLKSVIVNSGKEYHQIQFSQAMVK